MHVSITVNGVEQGHEVEPRTLLVQFLREACGLTGTKIGCDTSSCGACTVLYDGESVKSCTMFAAQADGGSVMTIEGLAPSSDEMHAVQTAFHEHHGLQCGFCTPGFIMTTYELLQANVAPTTDEIRAALGGNLCRCSGYVKNVDAAMALSERSDG